VPRARRPSAPALVHRARTTGSRRSPTAAGAPSAEAQQRRAAATHRGFLGRGADAQAALAGRPARPAARAAAARCSGRPFAVRGSVSRKCAPVAGLSPGLQASRRAAARPSSRDGQAPARSRRWSGPGPGRARQKPVEHQRGLTRPQADGRGFRATADRNRGCRRRPTLTSTGRPSPCSIALTIKFAQGPARPGAGPPRPCSARPEAPAAPRSCLRSASGSDASTTRRTTSRMSTASAFKAPLRPAVVAADLQQVSQQRLEAVQLRLQQLSRAGTWRRRSHHGLLVQHVRRPSGRWSAGWRSSCDTSDTNRRCTLDRSSRLADLRLQRPGHVV